MFYASGGRHYGVALFVSHDKRTWCLFGSSERSVARGGHDTLATPVQLARLRLLHCVPPCGASRPAA